MARAYSDAAYNVGLQMPLPGNSGTAILFTPQKGTASETKAHTTTLLPFGFGRAVTLKRLAYCVTTALTGAGQTLALDIYNGATSVGSLSVTTQAAGVTVYSSSDLDSAVAANGYIRILGIATTTASDANAAVGQISIVYQESYA